MLTERQKIALENQIYNMLKESMFENGYFENQFYEKKKEKSPKHDDSDSDESNTSIEHKRDIVMKWLDSDLELHSTLANCILTRLETRIRRELQGACSARNTTEKTRPVRNTVSTMKKSINCIT